MLDKKEYLLITFPNVTEAMRLEAASEKAKVPGRLIPVPRQIISTCGMAFRAEPGQKQQLADLAAQEKITVEEYFNLEL